MNESARVSAHKPLDESSSPVIERLFEYLPTQEVTGYYVSDVQTWSHRDAKVFSPVKLGQEM